MKILVIQQKMIGDVLTSTILLEALREKYPNAELHYLINSHTFPVAENNPFIDEFVFFSPEIEKSFIKMIGLSKKIRKSNYDVLIDCYSKLSSNFLSFFSKAKVKISYRKDYKSFIYNHNIEREKHSDDTIGLEITNRLKLLEPLNIEKRNLKPKIYLTEGEIVNAKNYLEENTINFNHPIFMISVLGSAENKTYPLKYMAQIIDIIAKKSNGQILFNYIPSQKIKAKEIFNLCSSNTKKQISFNVFGKSLREFLAITKHCTAVIGNEGGAINMAKALNIPTFAIYSPWINKGGWNMFEDEQNVSVHLIEHKPNLYKNIEMKNMATDSTLYYKTFLPEYIIPKLDIYLKQFSINS
ncbi:MAG: glycosyltransferase family 9 protein [Jejuia sp.]